MHSQFHDAVLAPNGHVICVPLNSDAIADLDPFTGVVTSIDISGVIAIDWKFAGGVLAPNKAIYFVPMSAHGVGKFDPCSGSFDLLLSGLGWDDWKFSGGVLAPNGYIYMIPLYIQTVGAYDPSTETWWNLATDLPAGSDHLNFGALG